ncbi:LacI family DNA-binding transcriptional regulator [Actinobacillus equuli subsp. haemolyticus]|uniref:LacI family DNA-binding transcriptional regulator n=1 Tax=Actinobacillus equuli TaxID=718 RepID=UPI002442539B|nr:LacI family DNA-binding transcriptional regulator [Actinobacillus equuli]WGE63391.1 LacI family DNA-binding transcriptional regulator [Actinobacillus equuli subsp. haemolyticus]
MKLTIKDIAAHCNVGKSTVSRVLNNDPKVSVQTRERVQAVIDKLGFQPNQSARAMRGASSPVVGIIVTRLNSTAESQTLSTILQQLYAKNITPLIVESQFQPELVTRHFALFRQRRVDGVILFGFSQLSLEIVQQWRGSLVTVARAYPNIPAVYYDDENAISALMTKLYQQGHRNIAYLGVNDQDETTGHDRNRSYLAFCDSHQIPANLVEAELTIESGYLQMPKLMRKPVSAILCASSSLAISALKYLQENQQNLPLACIGQNALLQCFATNLLTLDFGYPQAGKWAVELLLTQLGGKTTTEQRKVPVNLS